MFLCLVYLQDKSNVLLLSMGSEQRNLHWLLCEAQLVLTEEMHLHLIMEHWEDRKDITFFNILHESNNQTLNKHFHC